MYTAAVAVAVAVAAGGYAHARTHAHAHARTYTHTNAHAHGEKDGEKRSSSADVERASAARRGTVCYSVLQAIPGRLCMAWVQEARQLTCLATCLATCLPSYRSTCLLVCVPTFLRVCLHLRAKGPARAARAARAICTVQCEHHSQRITVSRSGMELRCGV